MKIVRTLLVCAAALSTSYVYASANPNAARDSSDEFEKTGPGTGFYSSSVLPDSPGATAAAEAAAGRASIGSVAHLRLGTAPFSRLAIAVTAGVAGFGIDVATPLATKINLRGTASFLNYSPNVSAEDIPLDTTVRLRSLGAAVDFFPYHNSFHISPGVTFYNGNRAGATALIAGGSTFTVNDNTFVSSPYDPVHGSFDFYFGRKVAPSFTFGFGNMLRRDSHWSIPVDIGFQYIGPPKLTINLAGSVCDPVCATIQSDPDVSSNLATEQANINNSISPLRFYPILKVGLGYRFGRNAKLMDWH